MPINADMHLMLSINHSDDSEHICVSHRRLVSILLIIGRRTIACRRQITQGDVLQTSLTRAFNR